MVGLGDPTSVCRNLDVWSRGDRRQRLDARPHADGALADLPVLSWNICYTVLGAKRPDTIHPPDSFRSTF